MYPQSWVGSLVFGWRDLDGGKREGEKGRKEKCRRGREREREREMVRKERLTGVSGRDGRFNSAREERKTTGGCCDWELGQ